MPKQTALHDDLKTFGKHVKSIINAPFEEPKKMHNVHAAILKIAGRHWFNIYDLRSALGFRTKLGNTIFDVHGVWYSDASVSRRCREFRSMGFDLQKRRVKNGQFEYRLVRIKGGK